MHVSCVPRKRKRPIVDAANETRFGGPLRIAVLQHASWEKPGSFARLLTERGATLFPVRVDEGEQPPPVSDVDGILAMGGPMSVNDPLPWLPAEMDYIRTAVDSGIPYFGVCLGAQLLAAALGAEVKPAAAHYGMHTADLQRGSFDDPLFGGLPRALPVFQWHGENFACPTGGTSLAGSPGCPHEAIRVGTTAYGLQFHLEVDPDLLAAWLEVPACTTELMERCGPGSPQQITDELREAAVRMGRYARRILNGWVNLVAARVNRE
ncbi:type 1 glutamine amidotransferase [Streptomyces odontomachi]|uniref:type 1 glutamine amidotransferase n=1 Tax=Streptomyces odontomachi TaxID=2944940 RepID=UPI00210C38CD|nr:type 1 glutamine amidotransferase [Streptomyces sp. ODS25]